MGSWDLKPEVGVELSEPEASSGSRIGVHGFHGLCALTPGGTGLTTSVKGTRDVPKHRGCSRGHVRRTAACKSGSLFCPWTSGLDMIMRAKEEMSFLSERGGIRISPAPVSAKRCVPFHTQGLATLDLGTQTDEGLLPS